MFIWNSYSRFKSHQNMKWGQFAVWYLIWKVVTFWVKYIIFFVLVSLDLEILKKQQLFLSVESNSIKFSTLNEFSKRHYMPLLELWHSDFLIFRYRNYFSTKINFQILICIHPINEICNSWWSCLNKCDCLCTHSLNY